MSKAVEQLLKKSEMDQFQTMSMPQITQKFLLAYAVETSRGEYPLLQSKRSLPAVNCGPGRPTDSVWSLSYAALITAVPLLAVYLENSATYSVIF